MLDSFVAVSAEKPVYAVWSNVELRLRAEQRFIGHSSQHALSGPGGILGGGVAGYRSPRRSTPIALEVGRAAERELGNHADADAADAYQVEGSGGGELGALRRGGRIDPGGGGVVALYVRAADCFTAYRTRCRRQRHVDGARGRRLSVLRWRAIHVRLHVRRAIGGVSWRAQCAMAQVRQAEW